MKKVNEIKKIIQEANHTIEVFYNKDKWVCVDKNEEYNRDCKIENGKLFILFINIWCYVCSIDEIKKIRIDFLKSTEKTKIIQEGKQNE